MTRCTKRWYACILNPNKRGITLDLTRPQGVTLGRRLVSGADIVVSNYSADVLPKLGLGYDMLRRLNARLVMMSISAYSADSIQRDCRAAARLMSRGRACLA
ncbi:CoA transferase [Bradyrhizobium japonicum]|uniref:CoA transferase n=1 Tax=Bradyrhizobium japonicum TaxID=375 RepID=UPI0024C0026E|nr:CoA transferase [Bradyrhizobium japonicum]